MSATSMAALILGFTFAVCGTSSLAGTVRIGESSIRVPAPESLIQATTPTIFKLAQMGAPRDARLLEVYALPSQVEQDAGGLIPSLHRYALVEVNRDLENLSISLDGMEKAKASAREEAASGLDDADKAEVRETANNFSDWVKGKSSMPVKIAPPTVAAIKILEETPTSISELVVGEVSTSDASGQRSQSKMLIGAAQVLVNSKIVILYLYSSYLSEEDVQWVAMNV